MTPAPPISDPAGDSPETVDPQTLIRPELREDWVVIPRSSVYQLVLVGTLLGAGAALSIVGWVNGPDSLRVAFPVSIAIAWIQNNVFPWSEPRLLKRLGEKPKP